ncbi:trichohyalin-like [Frankliniella occidentalis]|uniref:Trichohyalin-like n=1 Tax=Frankliniella occidentalis TaxID=133901 RepID=A0A9C6WW09_FRAOC|nr:trichohyalin-like [Frankliniella occidentalis]
MTAQQVRDATLMLRRPTVVDALQSAVPVPEGAVPRNGLPYWRRVPLGSRLPIIDHPKDAFVFYRDKLSQGLWQSTPVGDFRLDDPYMHEVDYTYEPVHDPALRRMFQAEEHRRILLERGFILPTGEAVCSLRQFNTYRRHLQTVYRELIRDEYRRRAVNLSDEQTIRRARQCEERQLEQDEKRMAREEKQGEQRANLEEIRRQKNQQLMARQMRYMELLERVEAKKEEQRQLAVERAREMDEKVKHRQAVAQEIQRAKVLATIQAWNREEKERKERLEKQQLQLQEYKEKEVARQWQTKVQVQTEREEREARLLARQEEALKLSVELRNKKVEREDLRMQALLKKIKADREKQRAKHFRFRPAKRKRPGRPSKSSARDGEGGDNPKRRRRIASTGFIADDENMTPLDRMFNMSLRMVKEGREHGQSCMTGDDLWREFRSTGFDPDEQRDGIPEAVATALDGLLDSVMEGIVHRMVMQTLKCVYHKALERCFSLLEDLPAREMARRGWVCQHGMMKHSELRERARAREERECRSGAEEAVVEESAPGSDPSPSPRAPRSPRKQRSRRSPERRSSEEERQRILRQIEAMERKNQQLKKELEQAVSSTMTVGSVDEEREAALDLDANFEVMAKNLQKKMVAIAAQSVSEETKLTTQHRWKIMKGKRATSGGAERALAHGGRLLSASCSVQRWSCSSWWTASAP